MTLIDAPGSELFDDVTEGEQLTVRGASVFRNGTCLARGRAREERELERALAEQRGRVTESLSEFAENTLQHLKGGGQPAQSRGSTSRRCGRASATGTRSSSPAGRATSATYGSCGRTSATSSRC